MVPWHSWTRTTSSALTLVLLTNALMKHRWVMTQPKSYEYDICFNLLHDQCDVATDTVSAGATRPRHVVAEDSWSQYDRPGRYQDDTQQYASAVLRHLHLAHSGNVRAHFLNFADKNPDFQRYFCNTQE